MAKRQMIDTESGKPKARARTIRRWMTLVAVLVVIVGTVLIVTRLYH